MSTDIALILSAVKNFKTGWKTSEFWVALSPIVVAALGVFGVGVTSNSLTQTLTIVWGAVAGIYVAARTFLKSVHIGHAANLAALLKQLESQGLTLIEDVAGTAKQAKPVDGAMAAYAKEVQDPVAPAASYPPHP